MTARNLTQNPWAAAACWVGAPFGGLIPGVLLVVTWRDRGCLVRRHALAATIFWVALLAIYVPVFLLGILVPAFHRDPISGWVVATVAGLFVVSWLATGLGAAAVHRSVRGSTRPTVAPLR